MSEQYLEQLRLDVDADLEVLKTYFDEIKEVGKRIKEQENRFDKKFYLESQDILSEAFDEVNRAYLRVKSQVDVAEAIVRLKTVEEAEKKPTESLLTATVTKEVRDLILHEALLEGWMKSTKNYLQTCRSHLNVLSGKETDDEDNS